jgi:hypothetical protein
LVACYQKVVGLILLGRIKLTTLRVACYQRGLLRSVALLIKKALAFFISKGKKLCFFLPKAVPKSLY